MWLVVFVVAGACNFSVTGLPISAEVATDAAVAPFDPNDPGGGASGVGADLATTDAAPACSSDCRTTCSPCCAQTCQAAATCTFSCGTKGCDCAFTCAAGSTCSASCSGGSRCAVVVEAGLTVDVSCADKSTCNVDCTAAVSCKLDCSGGSHCTCTGPGCTLTSCKPMMCKNGVQVCGTPCP